MKKNILMIVSSTQKKSGNVALQKTTQNPPQMGIFPFLVMSPAEGSMNY